MKSETVSKIIRWAVVISVPFMLTLITLRLLIGWSTPSYPEFEYNRIAAERYGFSIEDRLGFAKATLGYLRQSEPAEEAIYLLDELRMPNSDAPLYNQSEIQHMVDVKKLVDTFRMLTWVFLFIVAAGLLFLLAKPSSRLEGYKALLQGGLLTVSVLLIMLVLILVSWSLVFTQFHELLFPPDTWTFNYSDSLIRLFPEQFWFDFGLIWTGLIFLEGLIVTLVGYLLLRNNRYLLIVT
ncbi:MAG TPA: TIGR01906 family membrane protein [Patescibacteria group bacterium]|nr:TIGR01906 family membrane protein [Patescibacteria group bacterium]